MAKFVVEHVCGFVFLLILFYIIIFIVLKAAWATLHIMFLFLFLGI
jgi:hypothetical protein